MPPKRTKLTTGVVKIRVVAEDPTRRKTAICRVLANKVVPSR
jgi:hypothetical protein